MILRNDVAPLLFANDETDHDSLPCHRGNEGRQPRKTSMNTTTRISGKFFTYEDTKFYFMRKCISRQASCQREGMNGLELVSHYQCFVLVQFRWKREIVTIGRELKI
mmetsp:Transcript_107768/g.219927  ORF Transcript_107768/g.219927 Transcript_107768/m.219927 type:complete len:107 (-) Transcript_107768:2812-3132(-)